MLAFKFLREGGVGPFSNHRWPLPGPDGPGEWVVAERFRGACSWGIHGCDAEHLVYWLARELWIVELDGEGEVTARAKKLIAPRGRLIRRVQDWDAALERALAEACVARARELVAGITGSGVALAQGYLADAELYVPFDPAASMFCAAHAALTEDGFLRERAWQSRWLAERVGPLR